MVDSVNHNIIFFEVLANDFEADMRGSRFGLFEGSTGVGTVII